MTTQEALLFGEIAAMRGQLSAIIDQLAVLRAEVDRLEYEKVRNEISRTEAEAATHFLHVIDQNAHKLRS